MSILTHSTALAIYEDTDATNNPLEGLQEWRKSHSNITVSKPSVSKHTAIPQSTLTVFNGTRSTSINGTSAFSLTLNTAAASVYRATNTAGTAAAFRTNRNVAVAAVALTVAINNNATATFTAGVPTFGACQVGDVLFIKSVATGDTASPFNTDNTGLWTVLAASTTVLTVTRPPGSSFGGVAEAVTPAANSEFIVYSATGVQVGDSLDISAGFSSVTQKTFVLTAVTPSWVEFFSSEALPLEAGVLPTATGMIFYSAAKRWLRVEADQDCVLRLNGNSNNTLKLSPRAAGSKSTVAWFDSWGTFWSLDVVNSSKTSNLTLLVSSVE